MKLTNPRTLEEGSAQLGRIGSLEHSICSTAWLNLKEMVPPCPSVATFRATACRGHQPNNMVSQQRARLACMRK